MYAMYLYLKNLLEREEGQDLAEYALLLLLIAVAAIVAIGALSGGINAVLNSIGGTLGGAS